MYIHIYHDKEPRNLAEFCANYGINITATRVPSRADMNTEEMDKLERQWNEQASHWLIVLENEHGKRLHAYEDKNQASQFSIDRGQIRVISHGRYHGYHGGYIEGKTAMTFFYSMGTGHNPEPYWDKKTKKRVLGGPRLTSVLSSVIMDGRDFIEGYTPSFKEWAENLGYSTDSIRALKIYEACQAQAEQLKNFFTKEEMTQLLKLETE